MKLLDLFCCEGGASAGYHRAGWDVYGIDLFDTHSQKRYPFASFKGDAILAMCRLLAGESLPFTHKDGTVEWLALSDFDAVGASPPCQFYSITKHSHSNEHPDLLGPVRYLLQATGLPYVLENVPGAPLVNPLTLCGTEFGLVAEDADGRRLHLRRHRLFEAYAKEVRRGGYTPGKTVREALIGVDWMTLHGLSQSIPPAYTQHIGEQLITYLEAPAV